MTKDQIDALVKAGDRLVRVVDEIGGPAEGGAGHKERAREAVVAWCRAVVDLIESGGAAVRDA